MVVHVDRYGNARNAVELVRAARWFHERSGHDPAFFHGLIIEARPTKFSDHGLF
jgi:hypothetical protein